MTLLVFVLFLCTLVAARKPPISEQFDTIKGFNIGTNPGDQDVCTDGIIQFTFIPSICANSVENSSTIFYFEALDIIQNIQIENFSVTARRSIFSPNCTISTFGVGNGTIFTTNSAKKLSIEFNCTPGAVVVDVTFTVLPNNTKQFSFIQSSGKIRDGFSIGTAEPYSDVISDGLPLPLWNPFSPPRRISARTSRAVFYFTMMNNETQSFGKPKFLINNPEALSIQVGGSAKNGGDCNSLNVRNLTINFHCERILNVEVTAIIPINSYNDVIFGFTKICALPSVGLIIGTTEGSADVVADGQVSLMWGNETGTAFRLGLLQWQTFYTNLTNSYGTPLEVASMVVTSKHPSCAPFFEGDPLTVINSTSQPFTMIYNCTYSGYNRTKICVSITLTSVALPINFCWEKRIIEDAAPVDIGVTFNDTRVAQNGLTKPEFQEKVFSFYAPGWLDTSNFFIRVTSDPTPVNRLEISEISAQVVLHSNDGNCTVAVTGELVEGGTLMGNSEFNISYSCNTGASYSVVMVNISFERFPSVIFFYGKNTGGFRRGFGVGTVPGAVDVVSDGIAMPLWNSIIFKQNGQGGYFVSRGKVPSNVFYIVITLPQIVQEFYPLVTSSIPALITVAPNVSVIDENTMVTMTITYGCTSAVNDIINFTFLLPPFRPTTFVWRKECGVYLTGFFVATSPNGTDVVSDGQATPEWIKPEDPSDIAKNLTANNLGLRFWFYQDFYNGPTIADFKFSVDPPEFCSPYIVLPLYNISRTSQFMDIMHNCSGSGEAAISMSIDFVGPYLSSRLAWWKEIGGPRFGFNVGTNAFENDVVSNSTTQNQWSKSSPTLIPQDSQFLIFWMSIVPTDGYLNDAQTIVDISVKNYEGKFLSVIPQWPLGPLQSSTSMPLSLKFDCRTDLSVIVSVTIKLQGFDDVEWFFNKTCPPYKEGLIVGTAAFGSDVATDGQATSTWSLQNHTTLIDGNIFVSYFFIMESGAPIGVTEAYLRVEQQILNSPGKKIFTSTYDLTNYRGYKITNKKFYVDSQNKIKRNSDEISVCMPFLTGIDQIRTIDAFPKKFGVNYNCSTIGHLNVTVTLQLAGNYTGVSFQWTKFIGGQRTGINIGTQPLTKDVVQDGVVTSDWKALGNTTIDESTWQTSFYIWMDDETQNPVQPFSTPIVKSDNNLCSCILSGPAATGGVALLNSDTTYLTITYKCPTTGSSNLSLTIEIYPFNSITFHWKKISIGLELAFFVNNVDKNIHAASPTVVENGQTEIPWKTSEKGGGYTSYTDTSSPENVFLYGMSQFGSSSPSTFVNKIDASASSTGCPVWTGGNGSAGGFIGAGLYRSFSVIYGGNCSSIDIVYITIKIEFSDGSPVTFGFKRVQAAPVLTGLPTWAVILVILGVMLVVVIIFAIANCCLGKNNSSSPSNILNIQGKNGISKKYTPLNDSSSDGFPYKPKGSPTKNGSNNIIIGGTPADSDSENEEIGNSNPDENDVNNDSENNEEENHRAKNNSAPDFRKYKLLD